MKYYIIDGKTGNIMRSTNDNSGYPSVWETLAGSDQHYWTLVKLPWVATVSLLDLSPGEGD